MKYLLIHGSWHGAWGWKYIAPLLIQQGYDVQCLELPGCGEDANNAPNIIFNDLYTSVFNAVKDADQPLKVVAHSSAGLMTARVCEELHERILHAYYISAWLPFEGKSLVDLSKGYNNSQLPTIFVDCGNPKLRAIDPQGAKQLFYHDCSEADQQWASERLRPKAAQPDSEKMPRVIPVHSLAKSTYILCTADRVVNPISQLDMATQFGFDSRKIQTIDSGHSPFLSRPHELFQFIS